MHAAKKALPRGKPAGALFVILDYVLLRGI